MCQIKSFVLCQNIVIQFGDELISSMGTYSGIYGLSNNLTISGRVVYVAQQLGRGMFAYCEEETAWVFVALALGESPDQVNPCIKWKAMSRVTETYDITTLETGWVVRRNQRVDDGIHFEHFDLFCVDCDANNKKRQCSGSGLCVENVCVCDEGSYGVTCQHNEPCQNVEIDSSSQMKWPAIYNVLHDEDGKQVEVYQRPVYISETPNRTFFVILFIGSRWIITRSENHFSLNYEPTVEKLVDYFKSEFHGNSSGYVVDFISEPVYINTILDTPSPVDLNWYYPKAVDNKRPDPQYPLTRVPRCVSCNELDYPCHNKGDCMNGKCSCRFGTFGSVVSAFPRNVAIICSSNVLFYGSDLFFILAFLVFQCQIDSICTSLSVEFKNKLEDKMLPKRGGLYDLKGGINSTFNERPVYIREKGKGMIAYCSEIKAWTVTYWKNDDDINAIGPCSNWTAKSGASYSYDVLNVEKWFERKNTTHTIAILPTLFIYECNDEWRKNKAKY